MEFEVRGVFYGVLYFFQLVPASAKLTTNFAFPYPNIDCSFSWSQALQLPLLELCKGKGELQLEEMASLYVDELKIASAAAKGEHEWSNGEGAHAAKEAALAK